MPRVIYTVMLLLAGLLLSFKGRTQISSGIVVIQAPSVEADSLITFGTSDTICLGQSATLAVAGGQLGTNAEWTWYAGNCGTGTLIGTGNSVSVMPDTTLTYFCTAEGGCNAILCRTITVYVNPAPDCIPLPLDLLRFDAVLYEGHKGRLTWATAKEGSLRHFVVEESADGIAFTALARIAAANGSGVQEYRYVDNELLYGRNFYRLRIEEQDGTVQYSPVRMLWYMPGSADLARLYPNPTGGLLYFELESRERGRLTTWIHNMISQKVVGRQERPLNKGKNTMQVDLKGLPDGTYFFFYQVNEGMWRSLKFVKKI